MMLRLWYVLMFTLFQCPPHCSLQWQHASRDYLQSYNNIWALLDSAMIFKFLKCGSFIRLHTKFIGNWRKSASWGMNFFFYISSNAKATHLYTWHGMLYRLYRALHIPHVWSHLKWWMHTRIDWILVVELIYLVWRP